MDQLILKLKAAEERARLLAEKDELTEAEAADFDAARTEIENVQKQIEAKRERMASVNKMTEDRAALERKLEQPVRKPIRETAANPVVTATERKFDSLGDFLVACRQASTPGQSAPQLFYDIQAEQRELRASTAGSGLQAAVPSDGGFFLQTDHEAELMKKVHGGGQILSRCRRRQLAYGFDSVVVNGVDESSRANGSRAGGVRGYWKNEADVLTGSQPKFHQIKLEPQMLTALYYATDKLLRNASFLAGEVDDMVASELLFKVEDAIVNGTGAGQPLGILAANCLVSQDVETGQTSSDPILAENISKMYSRLHAPLRAGAVWLVNQEIEPYLDKLNFSVGTGGQLVYVPAGGIADAPLGRLKGLPVVPVEFCQAPNTVGDIILANLNEYMVCERGGVMGASSIHVRFLYNESVFRFVMEVDGQPRWNDALTPYKSGNSLTLSPFVALAARS